MEWLENPRLTPFAAPAGVRGVHYFIDQVFDETGQIRRHKAFVEICIYP